MEYPLHKLTDPAQVQEWFQVMLPDETDRSEFFMKAATGYVGSIATFFNGMPGRPACTIANVIAMVRYKDFDQVLAILESDEVARQPIESLIVARKSTKPAIPSRFEIGYIGAIFITIQITLAGIDPGQQSRQLVADFIAGY